MPDTEFELITAYSKPFKMHALIKYAAVVGCNGISVDEYVEKYAGSYDYLAEYDTTFLNCLGEAVNQIINSGVLGITPDANITDDNRDPYLRLAIFVAYGVYVYYKDTKMDLKEHCRFRRISEVE